MRSIDSESDIQVVLKCDGENVVWKTPDELVSLFPLRGKGLPYKKRELSEDKNIATHPKNFNAPTAYFVFLTFIVPIVRNSNLAFLSIRVPFAVQVRSVMEPSVLPVTRSRR